MDTNKFVNRHVGISAEDIPSMLQAIGVKSVDELIDQTIPSDIRLKEPLNLPEPMTEREFAEHISELASKNEVFTSYIGMGWYDTVCPAPIQRNVFENPVWYTSYTPYQAEVSQGRLEALLNFQTVIAELTGLPLANCSLLDEATAAAEAATMFYGSRSRAQMKAEANTLFVDENVFASTLAVINTRMIPQGIKVVVGDYKTFEFTPDVFGAIVQYPNADGLIEDYKEFIVRANATCRRCCRPDESCPADSSGRMGCRRRIREQPTFRYPYVLRWPVRCILRYERRIQAFHPRTYHRHFQRCLWTRGLPLGFANTRTAYQT